MVLGLTVLLWTTLPLWVLVAAAASPGGAFGGEARGGNRGGSCRGCGIQVDGFQVSGRSWLLAWRDALGCAGTLEARGLALQAV